MSKYIVVVIWPNVLSCIARRASIEQGFTVFRSIVLSMFSPKPPMNTQSPTRHYPSPFAASPTTYPSPWPKQKCSPPTSTEKRVASFKKTIKLRKWAQRYPTWGSWCRKKFERIHRHRDVQRRRIHAQRFRARRILEELTKNVSYEE